MIHFKNLGTRGRTREEALGALGRQLDEDEDLDPDLRLLNVRIYDDGTGCDHKYVASAQLYWYQDEGEESEET